MVTLNITTVILKRLTGIVYKRHILHKLIYFTAQKEIQQVPLKRGFYMGDLVTLSKTAVDFPC
jgi:hypothetical protein